MEWFENDIDSLNNLKDFYSFFDKHAIQLKNEHDLLNAILRFKNKTENEDEKKLLQFEVDSFMFQFTGSQLFSSSYSNGKKPGQVNKYPDITCLQDEALTHVSKRAEESTSPLLKAHYYHLLWKSPIKNNLDAEKSCENYIISINRLISLNKKELPDYSYLIGTQYESLISIVGESNKKTDLVKQLTFKVLFKIPNISFWLKHGIIEDMLKHPKLLNVEDFSQCLSLFEKESKNPGLQDDFNWANFHLPTAIKIAQKTKSDVKKWHEQIGDANLRIAEKENNDDPQRAFIKLSLLAKAIDEYRLSGNKIKKKETEQKYSDLKPKVTLDHYRVDFDKKTIKVLKEHNEQMKKDAQKLLKHSFSEIYSFISVGKFFPSYVAVANAASKRSERGFLDFVTTTYFDQNKNIGLPKDPELRKILGIYKEWIGYTLMPFLHYMIILGIKSGRLTSKNLFKYLIENTWIGKPKVTYDLDGKPEEVNWIFLIAPAIIEFYNQVLAWGSSKYYSPSFILCIDSLALKIEGLFRDFSERFGQPGSIGKRKGMEETQIHDIIHNDQIRKYFNEDDLLLFDYVFSGDGGLNLRNNVAHCFYSEKEYHPDQMLLLFAVLLRIGKYNIKSKQ